MITDPVPNGYYPVYTDQPRGHAGYCAWHSYGTASGVPVQFGFFFKLDGDAGCDPGDTRTGHSQGLAALANVSGHELSEAVTDPRNGGWWDKSGAENADKCAWTFGGLVTPRRRAVEGPGQLEQRRVHHAERVRRSGLHPGEVERGDGPVRRSRAGPSTEPQPHRH